jgi:hypothetical protein
MKLKFDLTKKTTFEVSQNFIVNSLIDYFVNNIVLNQDGYSKICKKNFILREDLHKKVAESYYRKKSYFINSIFAKPEAELKKIIIDIIPTDFLY